MFHKGFSACTSLNCWHLYCGSPYISLAHPLSIMQIERSQSAGMLLRQVCANQAEELKAYKGTFPTLMKDLADLRENYHKQEKELQLELSTKLSLQAEVSKLRDRVECLTNDIKQVTLHNTKQTQLY